MSDERLRQALSCIPADDRQLWVECGMAVKSELGDAGFDLWDAWSQQSDKYRPNDARAVWRSMRASGGVTAGTLFHRAREYGWRDDGTDQRPSQEEIRQRREKAARLAAEEEAERTAARAEAARKAQWILSQCELQQHAYLDSKGFPDLHGLVWTPQENFPLLCIPMRVRDDVVGVQMIDLDGAKKFLSGARTKHAEFVIGSRGLDVFVEGYATGLSVDAAMKKISTPARVHCCFSAHNLAELAGHAETGFVVADNDESHAGEKAAIASGKRFWIWERRGDFNDFHRAEGIFRASQALRRALLQK